MDKYFAVQIQLFATIKLLGIWNIYQVNYAFILDIFSLFSFSYICCWMLGHDAFCNSSFLSWFYHYSLGYSWLNSSMLVSWYSIGIILSIAPPPAPIFIHSTLATLNMGSVLVLHNFMVSWPNKSLDEVTSTKLKWHTQPKLVLGSHRVGQSNCEPFFELSNSNRTLTESVPIVWPIEKPMLRTWILRFFSITIFFSDPNWIRNEHWYEKCLL